MPAPDLATLAIAHAEALCRAAVGALREVEDESDDDDFNSFDEASVDGFAVDIEDVAGDEDLRSQTLAVDLRRAGCAAVALHLLVARLGGVAVTRLQIEAARQRWGEDALLVALSGVADALSRTTGRVLNDSEVVAVHRARADARQLLQNPQDVGGIVGLPGLSSLSGLSHSDDDEGADTAGSRQVARALDSAIGDAIVDDADDHAVVARADPMLTLAVTALPLAALLRVRAATGDAARALQGVAHLSAATTSLAALPSSADELVLMARGDPGDAVAALLRAATSIAHALPEGAPLAFSLVNSHGDVVDDLVAAGAAEFDAAHLPTTRVVRARDQAADALTKDKLHTHFFEVFAHIGDDLGQQIAADVGPRIAEDVDGGLMAHEGLVDAAHVATLGGARVELAVGVGASAAFAEAIVAVGIDDAHRWPVETLEVDAARVHGFTAVDDDRGHAGAGEFVGAKQATGPVADHDHLRRPLRLHGHRQAKLLAIGQRRRRHLQMKAHPTTASIDHAPRDPHRRHRVQRHVELLRHRRAQRHVVVGVVEAEGQLDGVRHGHVVDVAAPMWRG